MKLYLEDDINDMLVLVKEDVSYCFNYDINGELEDMKLSLGDGTYINMDGINKDGNEKKYNVLKFFSKICEDEEE